MNRLEFRLVIWFVGVLILKTSPLAFYSESRIVESSTICNFFIKSVPTI